MYVDNFSDIDGFPSTCTLPSEEAVCFHGWDPMPRTCPKTWVMLARIFWAWVYELRGVVGDFPSRPIVSHLSSRSH